MWAKYGTHTEDADPLFGGDQVIIDFEPTIKERNISALTMSITLIISAVFGVYKKRR